MSKNNRTLLEFNNNLDAEFSWRRKELTLFKSKVVTSKEQEQMALLRSSLTMLYAHWEGFVKATATDYLNYVSLRRLKLEELTFNFVALCVKSKMNLESNKFKVQHNTIEYLLSNMNSRSFVPYKAEIDTKSNLNFDVFSDICFLLNIDTNTYLIYSKIIDSLLNKRNNIAHGRYSIIDETEFINYLDTMVEVITKFKNDLYDSAQSEKYKRAI